MVDRLRRPAALRLAASLAALLGAGAAVAGGAPAPLELVDLDGRAVSLARDPADAALVIHFWATWCASCVEELPALERAAAGCAAARVRVVAVNVSESAAEVRRYAAEHRLGLPLLLDPRGRAWRAARFGALPANRIETAGGDRSASGPTSEPDWRARLAELGCKSE